MLEEAIDSLITETVEIQRYCNAIINEKRLQFQQDSASPHYTRELINKFPHKWIASREPLQCPSRSLDLSPKVFLPSSHLKSVVYMPAPQNIDGLINRITAACRAKSKETFQSFSIIRKRLL